VHMNDICVSARVFTYIISYQDKLRSTMNESNGAENLHRPVYMHAPGFICIHVLDFFLMMHYHVIVLFDSIYFSFLSLSVVRTALRFH